MKVFNGQEFLASRECTLTLSDGSSYTVKDLSDDALTNMTKLDETASMSDVRTVMASALNTDVENLKSIGVVELQGAMGFLSESLFDVK